MELEQKDCSKTFKVKKGRGGVKPRNRPYVLKHLNKTLANVDLNYAIWLTGHELVGVKKVPIDTDEYNEIKTLYPEDVEEAMAYLKGKCWHCSSKLVYIKGDWEGRVLDKKCYHVMKVR
jgi:hypothetical protein